MTTLCTASKAAPLRDRRDDLYETPEVAVEALLAVESLPTTIWEPACGPGAIARVLRAHGHVVYATDLVEYDSSNQDQSGWDFLLERQLPIGVEAIVTNPPFKLATWIERVADIKDAWSEEGTIDIAVARQKGERWALILDECMAQKGEDGLVDMLVTLKCVEWQERVSQKLGEPLKPRSWTEWLRSWMPSWLPTF